MTKRIVTKIGNIFCVEIEDKYKCYFQYVCNDLEMLNSSVIRVFKSRYSMDYKPVLEEIIRDEVSFYAHTVLRAGIQFGAWYKVGRTMSIETSQHEKILWGTASDILTLSAWDFKKVNPMENWTVWRINKILYQNAPLIKEFWDSIEYGAVKPFIEIVDRIRLGYYTYTTWEYDIIKRIPHPDVDSYVKREMDDSLLYQHFLGENAIQEIIIKNGYTKLSEGNPLDRPKFWETNWKHREFVTEEEFKEAWNKYSQQ